MVFADKLSVLAAIPENDEGLQVYVYRRILRFLKLRRVIARIRVKLVNDEWRVMLIDPDKPDGPFYGADYSSTIGDDANSALLEVWIRESDQWEIISGAGRLKSTVADRIGSAIELAYIQCVR